MQTILGANGQIAEELTRELKRKYTSDIRLVSRNPKAIHDTDELVKADLTNVEATSAAVAGSEVAYFTAGLPMNSQMWEDTFPSMVRNVIDACANHSCKLVFFDNTYMYPGVATPQTEDTTFAPNGRKGKVRAQLANMVLDAVRQGRIEAVICRAPEFYGPGKTQSLTNSMFFQRIGSHKRPLVPINTNVLRSLIWTPDASRATALIGNTVDAFNQTWHLPVDVKRLTYSQMCAIASEATGRKVKPIVLPEFVLRVGAHINEQLAELQELLPRYRYNNIFDCTKFNNRFPEFATTTYEQGIEQLITTG